MTLPKIPSLSIGTDVCQISRILGILASDAGPKFVRRILTQDEMNLSRGKAILTAISHTRHTLKNPLKYKAEYDIPSRSTIKALEKAAQYVAGRWAAKEAVRKAYTNRRITFLDVEIKYEHNIVPQIRVEWPDRAAKKAAQAAAQAQENPNPFNDEQEDSTVKESEPIYSNWGPPIAVILGKGIHEDEYARVSISHDGDYAMASCVVDMKEPTPLKAKEPDTSETSEADVD